MRTVFIGSYGYGNLGDELCLIEAMQAFPSDEAHVWSNDVRFTEQAIAPRRATSLFSDRTSIAGLRPDRIVLGGGGVGHLPMFTDFLRMLALGKATGARVIIHNIGVANISGREWLTPETERVLREVDSFSVRDTLSATIVRRWGLGIEPCITRYPERGPLAASAERSRADLGIPSAPLLGLSVTSQAAMQHAMQVNKGLLQSLFEAFSEHVIVPVISTVHASAGDEQDINGFRSAVRLLQLEDRVACRDLLDPRHWQETANVDALRALIGELDVLVSQRKHNCVHAFATGVRAIGLFPAEDDSLPRLFNTVFSELPENSRLFPLARI
jgi:hypothetical protein